MRHLSLRSVRAMVLASLVALVAGTLTGCASSPPPAPPPPPPLPRYTTLAELGNAVGNQMKQDKTAKLTVIGRSSGAAEGGDAMDLDGQIRFDPTGPSMRLTQRVQPAGAIVATEVSMIVLPDQAYVKPPPGIGLPPGKSWLQIRPEATDPMSQYFNEAVRGVRESADPSKSFTQFGDAASIVESAEEPLDGVRTVRYRVRVDLNRAAQLAADQATVEQLYATIAQGITAVESTLWVNERNLPERVRFEQPLENGAGTFTLDARYREWGQPVDIAPPPADQVI